MKKAKVKLGLAQLPVPAKIEKARHFVTSMRDNSNFATPHPTLDEVSAATDALEKAFDNADGGGGKHTSVMHDQEGALDALLTELGHYVEDIAKGNTSIILGAGMDVKSPNSPVGELSAPENVIADYGSNPGETNLRWTPLYGAACYVIHFSPDPVGSAWTQAGFSTRAKFSANNLQSGIKYWFRISAIGSAGQGPWSNPVVKMCT